MNYSLYSSLVLAAALFHFSDASVTDNRARLRHTGRPQQHRSSSQLKQEYPYYHTTEELSAEIRRLAKGCGGMLEVNTVNEGGVSLDVVDLKKSGAQPVNRVFLLAGEHARELIGPETSLQFLNLLCGEVPAADNQNIALLLEDNAFKLVVNANYRSRMKVEAGQYCVRMNPNDVDLNRNWDEHWSSGTMNVGASPFSEPETRLVKGLVSDFKPTTFLSIHSGTLGLYMPWAYSASGIVAAKNQPAMLEVLKDLDANHCQCPFGGAEKEVGYPCPGTSVDYVYDKLGTPYSFAFEVWSDPEMMASLRDRWSEKKSELLQMHRGSSLLQSDLGQVGYRALFREFQSDFILASKDAVQLTLADEADVSAETARDCFVTFNPNSEDSYNKSINNWAGAYFDMSKMIAEKLKRNPVDLHETKAKRSKRHT